MIIVCALLAIISVVSITLLYFSVKKNLEFIDQQENILNSLESALQELNDCYKRINKKTKLELFSDEPAVKEMVDDMKEACQVVSFAIESLTGEKEAIEMTSKSGNELS